MIELVNLCKAFDGKQVLDNLNLNIETGETMTIIGQSGGGKSVMLKHIIGIMQPDSGQVLIDGIDLTRLSAKEMNRLRMKFGMVFQGAALFDSLNVYENVGFSLREHSKMPELQIRDRVNECLSLVGLGGIEDLMPSQLSGGMRKRVGIARALCTNPEIILYDEPTTGLDPIMADAINDLIKELHDKLKSTSIVVTHDMTSAYKISSRIAMLYMGKIQQVGTPDEIKNTKHPVVHQFITGSCAGPIPCKERVQNKEDL